MMVRVTTRCHRWRTLAGTLIIEPLSPVDSTPGRSRAASQVRGRYRARGRFVKHGRVTICLHTSADCHECVSGRSRVRGEHRRDGASALRRLPRPDRSALPVGRLCRFRGQPLHRRPLRLRRRRRLGCRRRRHPGLRRGRGRRRLPFARIPMPAAKAPARASTLRAHTPPAGVAGHRCHAEVDRGDRDRKRMRRRTSRPGLGVGPGGSCRGHPGHNQAGQPPDQPGGAGLPPRGGGSGRPR